MVAIIGVLAAVAIPAYNGYRNTAAQNAAQSEGTEIMKALQACSTIETLATCYTASVNMTLSKTCTAPSVLSALPSGTSVGCHIRNMGSAGCASAHVQGVGGLKHWCVQVDTGTGQINTTNSSTKASPNKYCKADGTCA